MLYKICLTLSFLALCLWVRPLNAHGRLWEPPGRSTMWRRGFNTPINYQDNELFCGGYYHQMRLGYRCGTCGDPFDGARENEAGGRYATGTISRTFYEGQQTTFQVELTANHKGFFEFKLCPTNDPMRKATQPCLDNFPVVLADGTGYKYYPAQGVNAMMNITVVLPQGLTCSQCVLQWRYHAGNNWGTGPDGRSCTGCGPQEEFYGCADIAILPQGQTSPSGNTDPPSGGNPDSGSGNTGTGTGTNGGSSSTGSNNNSQGTSGTSGSNSGSESHTGSGSNAGSGTESGWNTGAGWNTGSGSAGSHSGTDSSSGGSNPDGFTVIDGDNTVCAGSYGRTDLDLWCQQNCQMGFCPNSLCVCVQAPYPHSGPRPAGCRGAGGYAQVDGYDRWCQLSCALGDCPLNICTCS